MDKSWIWGALAGAAVVTAGGALASYHFAGGETGARVVSVKAVTRTLRTPHEECHDEQVVHSRTPSDPNRLAGTGLGAVVGGLLGHQVGGGNGRVLATVAGAAAGGYAGNRVEEKVQQGDTYTTTEQRCRTAEQASVQPDGYDVVYVLHGKRQHVHLDHDPGKTLSVRDGKVVTAG